MVTFNQVLISLPPTDTTTNQHMFQDHVTNIEPIKFKEIKKLLWRKSIGEVSDGFWWKYFRSVFPKGLTQVFSVIGIFNFGTSAPSGEKLIFQIIDGNKPYCSVGIKVCFFSLYTILSTLILAHYYFVHWFMVNHLPQNESEIRWMKLYFI